MILKCKRESLDENGKKIMQFTKGNIYHFTESGDEGCYIASDDNGNKEEFFNADIMFEEL